MATRVYKADELPVIFNHKLVEYKGVMLHEDYASMMPELENFPCDERDILLAGFQKSGSTWLSSILTLIINNGDPKSLIMKEVMTRKYRSFLYIEFRWSKHPTQGDLKFLSFIKMMPSPKTMMSHLPYQLLPRDAQNKSKIIYIYRDVKDVMVSLYYHYMYHPSEIIDHLGSFEVFARDFMEGKVADGPYFGHLHSYWIHRHDANVLFVAYESMLKLRDHRAMVKRIAEFLERPLSDDELANIVNQTTKDQMKTNNDKTWRGSHTVKDENGVVLHEFIRRGTAGGWRNEFSPELAEKTDAWTAANLRDYGFDSNPFENSRADATS